MILNKKIRCLLIVFLMFQVNWAFSQAQFGFELRTTNSAVGFPGETIIIIGDFDNNTGEDIDIQVVREENNMPGDWASAICLDVCLEPAISVYNYTLLDGDNQSYSMYFYTTPEEEASGNTRIRMTNLADTSNFYLIEYFASTSFLTSTEGQLTVKNNIKVFPTLLEGPLFVEIPAHVFETLNDPRLTIFDAAGKMVSQSSINQTLFSPGLLPLQSGSYFYSVSDEANSILHSGKLFVP